MLIIQIYEEAIQSRLVLNIGRWINITELQLIILKGRKL